MIYDRLSGRFIYRPLDLIAVKGKAEGVMIYDLVGRKDEEASTERRDLAERFFLAIQQYFKQNWDGAIKILEDIHHRYPSDQATSLYVERCKQFQQNPPGSDWNRTEVAIPCPIDTSHRSVCRE
jgi:adenylate cyclase